MTVFLTAHERKQQILLLYSVTLNLLRVSLFLPRAFLVFICLGHYSWFPAEGPLLEDTGDHLGCERSNPHWTHAGQAPFPLYNLAHPLCTLTLAHNFFPGFNIVTISILLKARYRFHEIPNEIPMTLFQGCRKNTSTKICLKS